MNNWAAGKRWSDKFLPEIKRILGECLISEPPIKEDMKHNTDLIALRLEAVRIACRVRKYEYYKQYPDEFTIRAGLPSGAKTELTKIIEGWGNYFFYGFADQQEKHLISWILGDLNAFRIWFSRQLLTSNGSMPGVTRKNYDGSSSFMVFKYNKIPNFIVSASGQAGYFYAQSG